MKRVIFYGPKDIRIEEHAIPDPKPGEILVKNVVALTCGTDVKTYMRGYPTDTPPYGFGHEAAGIVYKVGENVTKFKVGDRIVAHNSAPCQKCFYCKKGIPSMCDDMVWNMGAFAQYQIIPKRIVEQNSFILPENMEFETAALMEPLACVCSGVESIGVSLGDVVVVNGVGPIGLMFVRLLSEKGVQVIATDLSDVRLEAAKELGADIVFNAAQDDIVNVVRNCTEDERGCDISIEATGRPDVWEKNILMSRKGGKVLLFGGTPAGTKLNVDANAVHYSQLSIYGMYHTAPQYTMMAFNLLKRGVVKADRFISNSYKLEQIEDAILNHSKGNCIKNKILISE